MLKSEVNEKTTLLETPYSALDSSEKELLLALLVKVGRKMLPPAVQTHPQLGTTRARSGENRAQESSVRVRRSGSKLVGRREMKELLEKSPEVLSHKELAFLEGVYSAASIRLMTTRSTQKDNIERQTPSSRSAA